jgi:hypothetical protein
MKNIAIASLMLMSSSVFAHNLPLNSHWKSDYIVGKGSFSLHVKTEEHVRIDEDRNICTLNQIGLPFTCTLMAAIPTEGKLFVKPVAADRMTLVWGLEGSNYEVVHNLRDAENGFIRLLKIDNEGYVVDSVRLFRN